MSEVFIGLVLIGIVSIVVLQLVLMKQAKSVTLVHGLSEVRAAVTKLQGATELIERGGKDEFSRLRVELAGQNQAFKLEVAAALRQISDMMVQKLDSFNNDANQKIEMLRKAIADSGLQLQSQVSAELERVRVGVSQGSDLIRKSMDERLEQMRQTVDEKLQITLEARLGESFRTVTEQLNAVHKGLGEMQSLASGVGDLKRVLTNVKVRGTWGEVQLGSLLEEILRPEQYGKNVAVTGTNTRVEFAIRLPGGNDGQPRWLPIDAKFPVEDYQRILEASETGDGAAVEKACKALESTLRTCAKEIRDKYISEPRTTGFAVLFLATEGLYAEALRRVGFAETLQREFNVMLAGPSTIAALLTSLRVGFRTLSIEQKAGEVAQRLALVKTAFAGYAGLIAKVKKRLQEATNTVEAAEKGTNRLQKVLRDIETDRSVDLLNEALEEEHNLTATASEA